MLIAALVTIAKRGQQAKCSSLDEWTNELCYTHIREYYPAVKRNGILTHTAMWTNLENIMLSDRSKTQRPRVIEFI